MKQPFCTIFVAILLLFQVLTVTLVWAQEKNDNVARGNFFLKAIGFFVECNLGLTTVFGFIPLGLLLPSPCVCNEAVMRREINGAILFSIIPVCADTTVDLKSGIDISGKTFVLYCEDTENVSCQVSNNNGPLFFGSPGTAGWSDLVLGPSNNPDGTGGALQLNGGKSVANRVVFRENRARSGGAVSVSGTNTEVNLNSCTFTNNEATLENGGAVHVSQGSLVLQAPQFTNNKAVGEGGGLFAGNGAKIKINPMDKASGFKGNAAGGPTNDIYVQDGGIVTCEVSGSGNRIAFCDGVAGIGPLANTNCETDGTDGPPSSGNTFCPN